MIRDIDLDHVAVAVEGQEQAWPRYAGDLGGEWLAGGGTAGFWSGQVRYANGMKVEVLEPHLVEQNDFLRRFLDRNGPGPHHLTFKVKDIAAALDEAEAAGYRPVGVNLADPMWKEAFLHPKDAPGVVVQLAQAAGDWKSPAPASFPGPARPAATLIHVAHAVASLDEGVRLFAGLLGGHEVDGGEGDGTVWVDLAWPGPGRVRLIAPAGDDGPGEGWLDGWLDGRPGRVHHLAFAAATPASIDGAHARTDGFVEITPESNLGVRILLNEDGTAFRKRPLGYM